MSISLSLSHTHTEDDFMNPELEDTKYWFSLTKPLCDMKGLGWPLRFNCPSRRFCRACGTIFWILLVITHEDTRIYFCRFNCSHNCLCASPHYIFVQAPSSSFLYSQKRIPQSVLFVFSSSSLVRSSSLS